MIKRLARDVNVTYKNCIVELALTIARFWTVAIFALVLYFVHLADVLQWSGVRAVTNVHTNWCVRQWLYGKKHTPLVSILSI